MKRVLLCWELGGGIGYTGWLIELARGLQARGCDCVLALRELVPCVHQFAFLDAPVMAAPVAPGLRTERIRREGFNPVSFADLMAVNGFGQTHSLNALVRAWRGLIEVVKPDLVVGAFSPVLGVAAYGRVPLALIGYGYTVPPADQATFPLFRDNRQPYADQAELLARVRRVQESLDAPVPERLTDIYRGDARFILSFPELDPYRDRRNEPLCGPLEDFGPLTPPPAAPRFYAYLVGGKPFVPKVVEALARCGLPGAIYMRDANMAPPPELAAHGVQWLTRPPPLAEAVRGASVVVHHGGANSVHAALAAGRPQVIVPRNLDQSLVGQRARELGVGVSLANNAAAERISEEVTGLVSDGETLRRVKAYAEQIRARGQHNALPRIVESCLDLLR